MTSVLDPEETETRVLHDLVDFKDKDVLEVGCGDGRLTWRYAEQTRSVLACDPKVEAITAASAQMPATWRDRIRFRVADITTLALPEAAFDVALFSWSI